MSNDIEVLWSPAGHNLPSLGAKSLVDVSDGDTPNIRMPIRMLSIDTPEVTARSERGAERVDDKFKALATFIKQGVVPVSKAFRDYILPKLEDVDAGTLQYEQGKEASAFHKDIVDKRLTKEGSTRKRKLFIRTADSPFDNYGRLLAYIAPSYSKSERNSMTRAERATFNLDLIGSGWAAPFILFPSIPGELDLSLFVDTAEQAKTSKRGQYANELSLPGYEYRMCEKLFKIAEKLDRGDDLSFPEQLAWRSRYCADMSNRQLHGPEDYTKIPEQFRLWLWPDDVREAIAMLNLVPKGF